MLWINPRARAWAALQRRHADEFAALLPHVALWALTLPIRCIGWAVSLRPTRGRA